MVFLMWLYAAAKFKIDITHRFFEPGHSFSEVDSMHGNIEKAARKRDLFHPDDWTAFIRNAKENGEVYDVVEVRQEKVFNFHDFVNRLQWKKVVNNQKVMWTSVKQVRVDHLHPDTIFIKYELAGEESKVIINPHPDTFDISLYELKRAHQAAIPLNPKKIKDLKSMLDLRIIPQQHRPFY